MSFVALITPVLVVTLMTLVKLVTHVMLVSLMEEGRIPRVPVYLDSPMAIDVSGIYHQFHQHHKLSSSDCSRASQFVQYTHSVKESQSIAEHHRASQSIAKHSIS